MMNKKLLTLFILLLLVPLVYAQNSWHKLTSYSQANSFSWMDVGQGNVIYGVTPDRWVYYSEDNGESWIPFVDVPSYHNITFFKASKVSGRVFAKSLTDGIIYTDDHGASWDHHNLNSGGGTSGFGAQVLAIGLKDDKIAVSTLGVPNNVFISTNNGNSFSQVTGVNFTPKDFHFLTTDKVLSNASASGLYFTNNIDAGGWQQIAFSGKQVSDVYIHGDSILAAINDGSGNGQVQLSTDEGQSWTSMGGVLVNQKLNELTVETLNGRPYVTTNEGINYFDGTNWVLHHQELRTDPVVVSQDHIVVFSGLRYRGIKTVAPGTLDVTSYVEGLKLSTDLMELSDNDKIYMASHHKTNLSIYDINQHAWSYENLFDTVNNTKITAMGLTNNGEVVIGGLKYIAKANISGVLSILANNTTAPHAPVYGELAPFKMSVGNNNAIALVQHSTQNYVDYSLDMGSSWSILYDANTQTPALSSIEKVLIGTSKQFVYGLNMMSQNVILVSDDGGSSWTQLPDIGSNVMIRNVFIDHGNTIFAVTTSTIYKWNDIQNMWEQQPVNFSDPNNHVEIAFDESNDIHVLVRTALSPFPEEGIYASFDGGQTYEYDPFPTINGQVVRFKNLKFASGNIPIAFTEDKTHDASLDGIYYLAEESVLSGHHKKDKINKVKIYPNPTKNFFQVGGTKSDLQNIQIYTLSGQYVATEVRGNVVDMSHLKPGAYVVKVETKNTTIVEKVLVTE